LIKTGTAPLIDLGPTKEEEGTFFDSLYNAVYEAAPSWGEVAGMAFNFL